MRKSLATNDCPIARAADQIGDGWVLLILWSAHNGVHRFDDFQKELGVARNILADRLKRMVQMGLLEKKPVHEGARRQEYRITEKSTELRQILMVIQDWGKRWCPLDAQKQDDGEQQEQPQQAPKAKKLERLISA